MKKTILLGLCLLFSLGLNAQKSGQTTLGVSVGANLLDHSSAVRVPSSLTYHADEFAWSVSASAEVSKFLSDNFRISFNAAYGLVIPDHGEIKRVHALAVSPSFAFYIKLAEGLYLTPEAGAGLTFSWYKRNRSGYPYDDYPSVSSPSLPGFEVVVSPLSFEIKASEKLGIAASIGQIIFAGARESSSSEKTITQAACRLNGASSVGLRFYF